MGSHRQSRQRLLINHLPNPCTNRPKPTYKPTQAAYTQPMNQYQNSHNHHDSYDSASNYGQNNNAYDAPCFERAVGISCWTCRGQNMDECARNGYEQKCYAAQSACMVEVRKNDGDVVGVHMGCKAPDACWRNKSYNFGRNAQCHPERVFGPSVCRQCCQTEDNCFGDGDGYHFTGTGLHETEHDWDMDLLLSCEENDDQDGPY